MDYTVQYHLAYSRQICFWNKWKLLILPYGMFIMAILLLLYLLTDSNNLAEIQYGLWLIPCFVPFFTFGYKTWNSMKLSEFPDK